MEIDITWEENTVGQKEQTLLQELLKKGISETLDIGGGPKNAEIGLVLVDDTAIQELNRTYRGIDRPTDVLSFAMREKGEGEPEINLQDFLIEEDTLGDIVISVERARTQAEEYGHSLEREIVYLAVHGTLHLLGFEHGADGESVTMRRFEEQVMEKLGLSR
ncbi:MAG: Endoribonuclease YbeY [Candidatus Dichloromethanomonas elyunquensis]|nr:MAG: Endoribonuclease YbeY [Candidatus Dichloromethanomonas elyunquensis]